MAVQTEEVRDLVNFAPEGFLVTSGSLVLMIAHGRPWE